MNAKRSRWSAAAAVLVMALVGGCGGGAQGDEEAFCDRARAEADAFRTAGDEPVDPAAIGVLRDLALEAPEEIRSELEDIGDYSSEEELEASLREIRRYVSDECGVAVR